MSAHSYSRRSWKFASIMAVLALVGFGIAAAFALL